MVYDQSTLVSSASSFYASKFSVQLQMLVSATMFLGSDLPKFASTTVASARVYKTTIT